MVTRLQVALGADERWYWAVIDDVAPGQTGRIASQSVVTFDTKENAIIDHEMHIAARSQDGRKIRTKGEIHGLLGQAMQTCADCQGVELTMLRWHEQDENGCNWELTSGNGPDPQGCLDGIMPVLLRLQRIYNIPDEG